MAITRDRVQEAINKYLPQTANYAQSADLGERDPDALFERIRQIVFTSLLTDKEAVFYIIFLAAQRLISDIETVIGLLDDLSGTDQLKGLAPDPPRRIESYTKLESARTTLIRLSSGVATDGVFGDSALTQFKSEMDGFLSDEVKPNVATGNRAKAVADIRDTMGLLKTSWALVVERRELLFALLDKYLAEDLRTTVSSQIISAIQSTINDLLDTLPELSTTAQAEQAEQVLIDLAAAEAALTAVGGAASPKGTIIQVGDDGQSGESYLVYASTGRIEPIEATVSGNDARLVFDGPGGASFTSTTGTALDNGGSYTPYLTDSGVPSFISAGIEAGMYLTFVDTGRTHYIESVSALQLSIVPETPYILGNQRYAITASPPGTLIQSAASTLWELPGLGQVGSSTLLGGVSGAFVRPLKVTGSDGTNIVSTGVAAFRPRKAVGFTADQGPSPASLFTDLNALFVTEGVSTNDKLIILTEANVGQWTVHQLLSETELTVVGSFTTEAGADTWWYIEDQDANIRFYDATTSFLTDGITTQHTLRVLSGSLNPTGDYTIADVIDQTTLELVGGPFTFEAGIQWEARLTTNDVLYSDAVDFYVAGVAVGDIVNIDGEGAFTITAVNQHSLELDAALSSISFTGASFSVYAAPGTYTYLFEQADGVDFVAQGVSATSSSTELLGGASTVFRRQTYIDIDGVTYRVLTRSSDSPTDTLELLALSEGSGGFTTTSTFTDTSATFATDGVDPAKHELVIVAGTNVGSTLTIASVGETALTISGTATLSSDDVYEVWPILQAGPLAWEVHTGGTSRKFTDLSGASPFTADSVGWEIVLRPETANEERSRVDSYISPTEVWLTTPLSEGVTDTYAYVDTVTGGQPLAAASRISESDTLKSSSVIRLTTALSNALGQNADFLLLASKAQEVYVSRIRDYDGAVAYEPVSGFPTTWDGYDVELGTTPPTKAKISSVLASDGGSVRDTLVLEAKIPLGQRGLFYRILNGQDNESFVFSVPDFSVETNDVLNVWGLGADSYVVQSYASNAPLVDLTVNPSLPARLTDQYYAVTRDGAEAYGKYVLLDLLNQEVAVEDTTDALRLHVADVLIDYGATSISLGSGADGVVSDDGDADGSSYVFSSASADFSTAKIGDVITVDGVRSFIDRVVDSTTLYLSPEVAEGTTLAWTWERSNISASLEEVAYLRAQMSDLLEVVSGYEVETNDTIERVVDLLEEQKLDRAIELMYDGKIDEFLTITREESSYASRAKSNVQTVGASTKASAASQLNVDGGTYSPAYSATTAIDTSSNQLTPEVDTRMALARAVNDISDDELLRSIAFTTFEEMRNRAIYALSGEIESGVVTDTDATLPWIASTGSIRDQLYAKYLKARDALQYMIDNPDKFDDSEVGS